jgi:phosphatidylinositol glycan class C protein
LLVDSGQLTVKLRARVDRSSQLMCFALSLVVYFSSRAERVPTQTKRTKVRQRLVDGFLLACLLRLSSSLLRSLTASYSSDTVQSLVYFGMLLHLMACDYAYANGKEPLVTQKSSVLSRQKRPPFQGGTVSLNAALFSTTMLISRLQSNVSAFFVVCIAIVLFAFYPATRSAISASYPAHSSSKFVFLMLPV